MTLEYNQKIYVMDTLYAHSLNIILYHVLQTSCFDSQLSDEAGSNLSLWGYVSQ